MHARRRSRQRTSRNQLLAALPDAEYRRLLPLLRTIPLPFKHVLQVPGAPAQHIYFPSDGAYSITRLIDKGRMVEVATVGYEGFIGIDAVFGGTLAFSGAVVKVPDGGARVMPIRPFQREMDRGGPFARAINRFTQKFVASLMQSAACHAVHSVEQRCARWLLSTGDRVGGDEFPLTQEFLAVLLGVRRPSVTLALGALQHSGLIDYGSGRVIIRDRGALKDAACECYGIVKRQLGQGR
jgi:CRP-like cAMP-binding protein